MSILPWTDWQFWVVTLAAFWGGWGLVRQLLPRRGSSPCGSCALGAAAAAKRPAADGPTPGEPPLVVLGGGRTSR